MAKNANSALLIAVSPADFPGDDPLAGVRFQREWEQRAFQLAGGNYRAPAQRVGDFLQGVASTGAGDVAPTYRPGVTYTDLARCLPEYAVRDMREAIRPLRPPPEGLRPRGRAAHRPGDALQFACAHRAR